MNEDAGPPAVRRSCLRPSQLPPLCPVAGSTQHQDGASVPCMPSRAPPHPTRPLVSPGPEQGLLTAAPSHAPSLQGLCGGWGEGGGWVPGGLVLAAGLGHALQASSKNKLAMLATACPPPVCHPRSHHVSWARSPRHGNSSRHSHSGSHAGGGEAGLAVGALGRKVETMWGPQHASRRPAPAELPASDAAPQRRRPQPVLAAVWDCGAHLVLGEKEGCRGGPIQAHRPRLNTGTPSGCSAQAHTWLSFSPCPLPGPGGHPPLQQLTCPRAWAGLEQTLCSENPPAWSGPAYSSPISDQCSQHPGLLPIPCPRI